MFFKRKKKTEPENPHVGRKYLQVDLESGDVLTVTIEQICKIVDTAFPKGHSKWGNVSPDKSHLDGHGMDILLHDGVTLTLTAYGILYGAKRAFEAGFLASTHWCSGVYLNRIEPEVADGIMQYALFGYIRYA